MLFYFATEHSFCRGALEFDVNSKATLESSVLLIYFVLLSLQTQEPKSKAFFTVVSLFRKMRFYANTLQEAQDWVAEINNTKPLQFYQ